MYIMRQHRTVEHYDKLNELLMQFRRMYCIVLGAFFIPAIIVGIYVQFTDYAFNANYGSCGLLADLTDRDHIGWSYNHPFRLLYLFFDVFDCVMFFIDSSVGMVMPYSATIFVTYDLSLRYDTLSDRVSVFNERLQSLLGHDDQDVSTTMVTPIQMVFVEDLEQESNSIFNEIIGIFEQVRCIDEFVRRFGIFTFFCWFSINMSLQAFSIFEDSIDSSVKIFYIYMQIYLHTLFILTFVTMSRPHRRSRILYSRICSAMALCSNIPVLKISWRWLLEYYRKDSTKYTLHFLGESYSLSTYNVLRAMSWFVTCTMIILTLWKQKQELQ